MVFPEVWHPLKYDSSRSLGRYIRYRINVEAEAVGLDQDPPESTDSQV